MAETSGLEAPQSWPGILGGAFKLSLCGVEEAGFAKCVNYFSLPGVFIRFYQYFHQFSLLGSLPDHA